MLETATIGGACKPPGPICLWMHVSLETYEQGPSAPAHSFEILNETDNKALSTRFCFPFPFFVRGDRKKSEIRSFFNFEMRIMGKFYYRIL